MNTTAEKGLKGFGKAKDMIIYFLQGQLDL